MEERKQISTSISRRDFIKLLTLTLGTGAGTALLTSCSPKGTAEFQVNIEIEQSEVHYSPATLTVPRNATVVWLNKSYYSQSVTCDPKASGGNGLTSLPQGAQPWNSGLLYPGQRFSKTFDTPGTYVYFSQPMLSPNTVGTIIVAE